jgi:hypothetical protein
MSRLVRVTLAAALAAAAFAPSVATAAPCQVTVEQRKVGGTTWTAVVLVPTVTC